jgi:Zn-dependent protease
VAKYFGDNTAYVLGRVSLNPVRHIDMVGTILLPLLILVASKLLGASGILFGWAKPVPVDFSALRHPKRDMLWVAAAGPLANLFMAMLWAMALKIALIAPQNAFTLPLSLMAEAGITVNLVLMVLNLLPILPLDGGRITVSLLPNRLAYRYSRLEPYGFPILLVLLFTNTLGIILNPPLLLSMQLIESIFQIQL